jgi:hypothetical protein
MTFQTLNLEVSNPEKLPVFKVTMLGDSGAGKTVFMAAMYMKLQEALHGVSVLTDHDTHRALMEIMDNLADNKEFPPGTIGDQINYNFQINLGTKPIAHIDWVDYRGGAMRENSVESQDAKALIKRISDSHAVFCLLDLNEFDEPDSTQARRKSQYLTMKNFCKNATEFHNNLRSVIFVRTKSDAVRDEAGVKPDWIRAKQELISHLKEIEDINVPFFAALPVSAAGRVDEDHKPLGKDDPYNTEWTLILAVAFLQEYSLRMLEPQAAQTAQQFDEVQTNAAFSNLWKRAIGTADREAKNVSDQYSELNSKIMALQESIVKMLEKVPESVAIFRRQK